MVLEKKKLEFTEEQKTAISELKTTNEERIKELECILGEYKKKRADLDGETKKFWEVINSLERSNSHYPLGHFTNYYYVNFEEPCSESFITERGDKNLNFKPLTEQDKKVIENKFPDYDKYNKIITETIEKISVLIKNSLAENIFIKRLAGLPEKYTELEGINGNWWYPPELSQKEYGLRGTFATYDINLTIKIPYHRKKMIRYGTLFNTDSLLGNKIEKFILVLKSINTYLPFADLIPSEKMPQTVINVEANANNEPTSVGDSNEFQGDTAIGKGGQIGE